MMTSANSSDSKLLSLYFCCLREPPYWMLVLVMVDTKLREGSKSIFLSTSNRPELFALVTPLISTLKQGLKVQSDHIKRFPAHGFL